MFVILRFLNQGGQSSVQCVCVCVCLKMIFLDSTLVGRKSQSVHDIERNVW